MRRRTLLSDWTLEAIGSTAPAHLQTPFPVSVPGSAHAALADRGDIDDLTIKGRVADQEWVARTTWRYRTTVLRPEGDATSAELVFHGIDTVATILIDGAERLQTANMFRTYRLDVSEDLGRAESIDLAVELAPDHVTTTSPWRSTHAGCTA